MYYVSIYFGKYVFKEKSLDLYIYVCKKLIIVINILLLYYY